MSATKSQRSPRRKAGRASARNATPKLEFRLMVEGQEMQVSYEANWWGGEFPMGTSSSAVRTNRRAASLSAKPAI